MTIRAELADGRILEFPDGTDPNVIQATVKRLIQPSPVAPSTERTFGEAIKDVPASLATGLGGLLQVPGQLVQLVPGLQGVGQALEAPGKAVKEFGEDLKSAGLKAREALRSQALSEAEKEGVISEFVTAIKSTITDPALLTSFITEQVPLLLGPAGAAKVAQMVTAGGVAATAAGTAARAAAEAAAAKTATRAAIGTGAAMQAGDVSSDTYQTAYKRAIEMGMTPDQANDAALNAARIAAAGAGVTSLGATAALSKLGGAAIERRLAGLPGTGRVKSGLGEAVSETGEEVGGQFFSNVGVRTVDPNQSLTTGLGTAAAMGALGGGVFGTLLGKSSGPDLAPGQKPGESLYDTAMRLNREIKDVEDLAKLAESDKARASAGLMTNTQLVDMYREQGYGVVKTYQQQLINQANDPTTPPEQRAAAREAAQQIQDLFKQVNQEEVSRRTPSEQSYKITASDLTKFDIKGSDPVYRAAFGKDISDPVQVQEIQDAIDAELNRKGIRQTQAARLLFFKDALDRVVETLPAGGLRAATTDESTGGEGAGVAGVSGVGATTAGSGAAKPSRVVPAEPAIEEPAGGKAEPTTPVMEDDITPQRAEVPAEVKSAQDLLSAIDAGGVSLNTAKLNKIARDLGLEVSKQAKPEDTISRIREAVTRAESAPIIETPAAPKPTVTQAVSELPKEITEDKLPKDLAGAKPRFAYGPKQFQLTFENDIAKALFITAQATPSKRDADYRAWLTERGFEPEQIELAGKRIRERIKTLAKNADPEAGPIRVPFVTKPVQGKFSLAPEVKDKLEPIYKRLEQRVKTAKPEVKQEAKPEEAKAEAPKEKTQKDLLLERRAELVKQLDGILKKILAKYNLTGVKLNLEEGMAEEGSYSGQIIKLALNLDNPVRVLRHESIHALKDMGFFSDAQWKTLVKRAQDEWVEKYLKNKAHTETQSRYDAYVELLTKEGLNPTEVQEAIIEEAIADAFGDFDVNGAPPGLLAAIHRRMKSLFKAIKEAFGRAGIDTAEEIFGKIEKGSLKPAIPMGKEQAPKPSLRVMRGEEKPEIEGKVTVDKVGQYFDDQIIEAFGRKLDYSNEEDFNRAAQLALDEVRYQLKQNKSGLDWYEEDIKNAFKDTIKIIPNLKQEENRILFSVIAGIMSPQTNARDNWFIAAKAYQHYTDTKDIPGINPETGGLWQGGTQSANKKVQLEFLDRMVKDLGQKDAVKWLLSDHTVKEINEFRSKYGNIKSGIEGKLGDVKPGLYAFGPKVGPFVSNLNGIHDVTVDKWMTRTFNRYFGTMVGPDGKIVDAPTEPQRRAVKKLVNKVAQDAGIKPYQVQSVLWFYEQSLFSKIGTPAPSYGFSDGGRKFLESGGRGGEEGVEPAVGKAGEPVKKSLRGVVAEVAPNPDIPVAASWRQMTQAERLDATKSVAKKVIDPILSDMGLKGYSFKFSSGKYEGEVNPNILIEAPESATVAELEEVARVVGYILDQKAMVAYDEYNTDSGDQAGFVKVMIPAGMDDNTVTLLRNHISKEVPQADGDTLRDGALVYGNFSAYNDNVDTLSDEEYHDAIVRAIESFDYSETIKVSDPLKFHSQLVWPDNRESYLEGTRYGESGKVRGGEGSDVWRQRRSRLEAISEQAIALRDRWIDARGAARIGGRAGDSAAISTEPTAEYGQAIDGSESAVGVHFSQQPRSTLDSQFYGAGLRGMERERLEGQPDIRNRIYFYVDTGKGVFPEAGVGGSPHVIRLNNLYNALKDELGLVKTAKGDTVAERANTWEKAIKKAGFDGYFFPDPLQRQGYAVLIGKHRVETKLSLRSQTPEFKFWFGQSKIVDKDGNPKVMYHGTARDITEFRAKQAGAIFLTDDPEVATGYSQESATWMADHADEFLTPKQIADSIKAAKKEMRENGYRPDQIAALEKDKGILKTDEFRNAVSVYMPSAPNIVPLFVKAEYTFDFENPKHVQAVISQLPEIKAEDFKRTNNWTTVEKPEVQKVLRVLGFDSFYVNEHGKKNLAVYSPTQVVSATGNVGAYRQRPITAEEAARFDMTEEQAADAQQRGDIRFSLRSAPTTPEFKRWFGDSKVVDADGKPMVVFHASTNFEGYEFKKSPKVNRTGNPDGYYFSPSPSDAADYARDLEYVADRINNPEKYDKDYPIPYAQGAEIIPVYLSVKNPYDYKARTKPSREMIRQFEKELRKDNPNLGDDWISEKLDIFKEGRWPNISFPTDAMTRVIKSGGYDGMKDGRHWIAFDSNQIKSAIGNIGTYDVTSPDIRRSLRSTLPASVVKSMDKIAPPRYEPNLAERMMNAVSGDGFTRIRQHFLNRYEALAALDRRVAAFLKKTGGAKQYADSKAETAALFSDLSAGVLESVMGVHDGVGGAPIFRNGVTTVSNYGGAVKGLLEIFRPLSNMRSPEAFNLFQTWAAVKRGTRLTVEGREDLVDQADVKAMQDLQRSNPDIIKTFEAVQKDWLAYNNALIKYMKDTGVISPAMAKKWTEHGDYWPFYRLTAEEDIVGPKAFMSIGNVTPPKKLKKSENPLGDFFENVVRNSQSAIQAGMKNMAAQNATKQGLMLGEVVRLKGREPGVHVYRVFENGKEVFYRASDPLFIEAIKALNMADIPFLGFLAKPAAWLRNLVTKDPAFMLANMMRDSLSAWVTTGKNITPIYSTLRNFSQALAGQSPYINELYAAGLLGGYDYATGTKNAARVFEKTLRQKSGQKTVLERAATPVTSLWEALEKGTQASDAATRIEIYKKVLAETGNEAEALSQALEVMNFNRKGNSALIRVLTAAVPFLNARLQGLDVLYRSAIQPLVLGNASEEAKQRMKTFWMRGMLMISTSMMYWLLTHDDDEYKKQEQETRDDNWLIPSLGIRIPIPFEVGVLFKVLPERIMELNFGGDTTKDFTLSMKRQFLNTFAFNPMPQTVKPLYEVATNHSFFTQRPIIGMGMERVAERYQIGPSTSKTAQFLGEISGEISSKLKEKDSFIISKMIGESVGLSPMKIDYLIKGYTGTIGTYISDLIDMIWDMNSDAPKASKRFEQMPVIKRFILDPEARGTITSYYKFKEEVDTAVRTSNFLERSNNFEDLAKYTVENLTMLASRDYVNDIEKDMKDLREMRNQIVYGPYSADTKRDLLRAVNAMESAFTTNIQRIKQFGQK